MIKKGSVFFLALVFISCQPKVDKEAEKEKIKSLIASIDEAHFKKDAVQFYAPNTDSWYDIRDGGIRKRLKADIIAGTQDYLDQMEFLELSPQQEPIIEISDDGSLATYAGAVVVRGYLSKKPMFWVVSWQSVLKKLEGEWKIVSSANTEAAPAATAPLILEKARTVTGTLPDSTTIRALADCQGPERPFTTLVFSSKSDARMEQRYGEGHVVLKYGENTSWTYNRITQKLNESPDDATKLFVQGHELHWLSLRPEDRFSQPKFVGFEEFEGHTAFVLEFTDMLNRRMLFYYDFESYMPLGFDTPEETPGGRVRVRFMAWEEQNGIQLVDTATFQQGEEHFSYDFTSVQIGNLSQTDFESKDAYLQ